MRIITSYYDSILKPSGLRITQFTVLLSIGYKGSLSITDIANLTDIDRTTLQRSLEILRKKGFLLIEKAKLGNLREVSLTTKGEKILEESIPLWKMAQSTIEKKIGKEKFAKNIALLGELKSLELEL
ncbi:MarR family transcriptional regulator [Leptospira sp. 96542]|nr:MarR family transcriptional regulator [Leptospira sp. 96542]